MLPLRKDGSDDFQTPPEAVVPLLPYLKKDWLIWECAMNKGMIVNTLKKFGYNVIGSDINEYPGNSGEVHDFLTWSPEKFDVVVTNPPYSKRYEFIKRAYELNKPWAMLMPLTTLETRKRLNLFEEYGIELLLLDDRIHFITPHNAPSHAWFPVAWFTWKLLPKQIVIGKVPKDKYIMNKQIIINESENVKPSINDLSTFFKKYK